MRSYLSYEYLFGFFFSFGMAKEGIKKPGSGNSRGTRKSWEDKDMVAALEAVTASELTISAAASRFSVPRKTLDDRVKGRVKHGSKPGVSTVLTPTEEEALNHT